MPRKKRKGLVRPDADNKEHYEKDPPTGEYQWLNGNKARDPSNPDCTPPGLKGMSELDAIAWVRKHCKFAKAEGV